MSISLHFRARVNLHAMARKLRLRARSQQANTISTLLRLSQSAPTLSKEAESSLQDTMAGLERELSAEALPVTVGGVPVEDLDRRIDNLESLAASADSLDAYLFLLMTMLGEARTLEIPQHAPVNDADTRVQDAKDIERDQLLINGALVVGSEAGFDAVVGRLVACLRAIPDVAEISEEACELFSRVLLNAANRTSSGGDMYDVLERGRPRDFVMLCPDSSSTKPLRIDIGPHAGPFCAQGVWDFGVVAAVEAELTFLVYASDDSGFHHPVARIMTTMSRQFGLPVVNPAVTLNHDKMAAHKQRFALGPPMAKLVAETL
jgi:hypothetical protein